MGPLTLPFLLDLGRAGPDLSIPPISTQGAILRKFAATPALVAAVPGGLSPRVTPGPTPMPYATITHVANDSMYSAGTGNVYIDADTFHVEIRAKSVAECKAAKDLIYAVFNQDEITADAPLPLRQGNVFSAYPAGESMMPGWLRDKGGNLVYRQVVLLATKTSRVLF